MDRTDRLLTLAIRVVIVPGLVAATYLAYTSLTNTEPVCGTGGCSVINNSKWSEIFGIPVTVYGVAAYLTLMVTTFMRGDLPKLLAAFLAVTGAFFSLFLQWYALFELKYACPWCLTSAVAMLLLGALTLWRALRLPAAPDAEFVTDED